MPSSTFQNEPHRRFNPLSGEWILVSPQRTTRPWQGKVEGKQAENSPGHDPECYLCPGNTRISGATNPDYTDCFVFDNDFPAIEPAGSSDKIEDTLFKAEAVSGDCKVLCYSPDHSKTLPELSTPVIKKIIDAWCDLYSDLEEKYTWVQIFENKGEINGCSNPHPHGQIWASNHIPQLINDEDKNQQEYFNKHETPMLLRYAEDEIKHYERIICMNNDWVAVVPYWAAWPFETILLPRTHITHMNVLDEEQKSSLADILKELTTRYDNLFETSFPYSMGWHGRPANSEQAEHWQLHAHFYPPLLRSATVQKFMVGYELMAEKQRDITPEKAAEMLRNVPKTHYRSCGS